MEQKHQVNKLSLDVSFDEEAQAYELQNRLMSVLRDKLQNGLEELFNQFSNEDEIVRINKLEIDLGTFPHNGELENNIYYRILDKLKEALYSKLKLEVAGGFDESLEIIKISQGSREILEVFLNTGTLPWNARGQEDYSVKDLLIKSMEADKPGVGELLKKAISNSNSLERLVRQFDNEVLSEIVKQYTGHRGEHLLLLHKDLQTLIPAIGWAEPAKNRAFLWKFILTTSFSNITAGEYLQVLVRKASQAFSLAEEPVFQNIYEVYHKKKGITPLAVISEEMLETFVKKQGILIVPEDLETRGVSGVKEWVRQHAPFAEQVIRSLYEFFRAPDRKVSSKKAEGVLWKLACRILKVHKGKPMSPADFTFLVVKETAAETGHSIVDLLINTDWKSVKREELFEKAQGQDLYLEDLNEKVKFLTYYFRKKRASEIQNEKAQQYIREIAASDPALLKQIEVKDRKALPEDLRAYFKENTVTTHGPDERELLVRFFKLFTFSFTAPSNDQVVFKRAVALVNTMADENPVFLRSILIESGFDYRALSAQYLLEALPVEVKDKVVARVLKISAEAFEKAKDKAEENCIDAFWSSGNIPLSKTITTDNFKKVVQSYYSRNPEQVSLLQAVPEGRRRAALTVLKKLLPSDEFEKHFGPIESASETERRESPVIPAPAYIESADSFMNQLEDSLGKGLSDLTVSKLVKNFIKEYRILAIRFFTGMSAEKFMVAEKVLPAEVATLVKAERRAIKKLEDTDVVAEEPEPVKIQMGEPLYVNNAGLVILNPFLTRFFNMQELLNKREFKDEKSSHKAVHLLQYLANKGEQMEEHELLLNKLLCGIPFEKPVYKDIVLTDKEKETCDSLLEGVIENWAILKKTSPDSLRGSFLLREGRLTEEPQGWRLRVEEKGYDVLVEKLPWSIGMLKLPWMKKMLFVDWK